jgi:hypothetical protein
MEHLSFGHWRYQGDLDAELELLYAGEVFV